MIKHQGFVEAVGKDGKRFKLDDGSWYSAFASTQVPRDLAADDYVQFSYVEKGEYRNIKGNVTKATPPASSGMTAAGVSGASESEHPYLDKKGYVLKMFPVPGLHPDRSIIRQNSLGHAINVLNNRGWMADDCEKYAEAAVGVARIFEAYSTGEIDVELADEEIRKLQAREAS